MAPHLPRRFSGSSSSSSSNGELVDSIISQAMDEVALEQVAALNTAHLDDDDAILPDHLDSRFRKLKSFPGAAALEPRARSLVMGKDNTAATEPRAGSPPPGLFEMTSAPEPAPDRPGNDQAPPPPKPRSPPPPEKEPKGGVAEKAAPAAVASDSRSSKPAPFLPSQPTASASRSRGLSLSPRLHYRSPSPPRGCCFGLSPKSKQKICSRKSASRGGRTAPRDLNPGAGGEWDLLDDDDALLTELELGTLSIKEQGKRMKRALREQEKAAREAEKIVEWVRQASARMEYSAAAAAGMDELLSDEEKENRM